MDAYAKVDLEGRIVESNQTYRNMTGYSEEELSRLTYMDITPEKWHDMETKIVREQLMERGYTDVYEKEYRRRTARCSPSSCVPS